MTRKGLLIKHAIDCIERIEEYTDDGKDAFLDDSKTQDAVIRNLEIIGQCIKDYGVESLKSHIPDTPWEKVAGTRNVLAHEYLGVDPELVWEIVEKYLGELKDSLKVVADNSSDYQ